jgi:anaerobic magnesium-protoporphyrin IX monomethyl ester cyclase
MKANINPLTKEVFQNDQKEKITFKHVSPATIKVRNKYPSDDTPISERRKDLAMEEDYPWEQKIPKEHELKILLINPPAAIAYGNYKAAAKVGASPQMPLGLLYLATVLDQAGHKVKVIDCDIDNIALKDIFKTIEQEQPDVVGLTATTPIFLSAKEVIKQIKIKFPEIITLMGGYHFTALPIQSMQNSLTDYGIYGEGEATITHLINYLGKIKSLNENPDYDFLKSIKGLLVRCKDKIIVNEKRPLLKNLDRLPYPKREYLRYKKYLWSVPGEGMVPVTSITTQRGCPFQCIFCGAQTMFPGLRLQSIPRIIGELKYVVNELGIKHIQFQDDTLTLNRRKVEEMLAAIEKEELKFTWEGYTRANTIDKELLEKMQNSGLNRLSFGVETGNEKILKAIKKGVGLESYKKAYQLCHELGIETRCSLMFGHPFETKETIKSTMKFANSLKCYQAYINITTPYPGSELLELARKKYGGINLLTEDWTEYRRYGNSVMTMNDLTTDDLIKLQKWGYRKFYLRPHIIWYNVRRAGFKAAIVNGIAFFKSVILKE